MIFLLATWTSIPLTTTALVLILLLSRDELQVSAAPNGIFDGRFSFEDSNCPQSWKRQLELEPELVRPSLQLWTGNDTRIFDGPSPKVIHMGEEYQAEYHNGYGQVKMRCKAPYPVILLAAYEGYRIFRYGIEVFHVTITNTNGNANIYNRSSYKFETETFFRLPVRWPRNKNIFYCQAVHNPCLKSREKLLFFYDKSTEVMSFTLRHFSFPTVSWYHHSKSKTNSSSNWTLNPNSSSISPSEFKSIFGTKFNLNQSSFNSSSKDQDQDQDRNNENNTDDSECEAFFYYEELRDEDMFLEGRISLRYSCEFSDGAPGTVESLQRCGSWGRCGVLRSARKQKAKNCWRPYIAGKTCLNCTTQDTGMFIDQPFIPTCRTYKDGDEFDGVSVTEVDSSEEDRKPEVLDIEDDLEKDKTDENTEKFEATTETEDNSDTDDKEDGDESPSISIFRSVEGTPLYVGFPPPGFQIQRTDAFDQDDLEESTLVRMNPFPEIQLFNTTIQISCDSNDRYTSKIFVFALEFQSQAANGKGAQKNLQFFPVDKTALWKRNYGDGYLNSQTLTLHLNRTDITRVFCFAGVQNSFKWINASRPIRVLEYKDFYKPSECLVETEKCSTLRRPQLSVHYVQLIFPYAVEIDEDHPQFLLSDGNNPTLTCSADYPIQVLSTFNHGTESRKFSGQFTQFGIFENHSSYSYKMEGFKFEPETENHFYRCQSLENPCLHRSLLYSYVPGPTRQLKFEHVPQNDNDSSKSNSDLEFGSPANYPECQVLFFYKELPDFPGYEFRCEFPLEEAGTVNFHYCDSLNDCANLYRNRRQPKVCWRKVENWMSCEDCESRSVGFRPFVATCQTIFYNDLGSRVVESTLGSFAVFGLPNQTTGIAPIYFSNEEIEANTTIFMEPFEKYQFFNTTLNVTCVSSAYYMSNKDTHFGIFYDAEPDPRVIKFSRFPEDSDQFKIDPEQHEWRITRNIKLGNEPGLTNISCIGINWLNVTKFIRSTREIHIQAPQAPKIVLGAGNGDETSIHLHGNRTSQISNVEEEYYFLVNSQNQTLVCHGHGFPPPQIQWETTAPNAPNPKARQVNSSHVVSRILLPLIDAGVQGTYFCTARNSQGKSTASLKIKLKYPVNKALVAIVTSSILIFIGFSILVALLWRRNRGLKMKVRDLTPEEVEEFHLGSRTVDPNDPLAEIYALPYDLSLEIPRELIQLDETNILGTGEFGLVRPGYIKEDPDRNYKKLVAIKQAKPKLRAEDFKNILSEIKVMSHLKQHENVLQILAACTTSIKKCQVLVVMEFCEMGDLHKYLRDRKYVFEDIFTAAPDPTSGYSTMATLLTENFTTHTLIDFSLGIANGMNYLRQKRVVHGDLAARNVLLTKTLQVKVSDFGYSTHLINYASYTKNEQMVIPWRWFSIEALKEMKLSFKSDVWAFGVLLYEIFTLGELPYAGVQDLSADFVQDLENGKQLEQPKYTNEEIYAVMTDCWQKEPSERPTFQEIYDRLLLIKNDLN